MHKLTKSDFLEYRDCWKSFWLKRNKPGCVNWRALSQYGKLLISDGYAVERVAADYIRTWEDAERYAFQVTFTSTDGLVGRSDAMGERDDGTYDLIEIKSSTGHTQHIVDVCFQVIAAERSGLKISSASIMHIDKEYRSGSEIEPARLFNLVDVTQEISALRQGIEDDIAAALTVLQQGSIDENSCDCRTLSRGRHCEAFDYFNPDLDGNTAYMLPRISASRLQQLDDDHRLKIESVSPDDVTVKQLPVLQALKTGIPVIDRDAIKAFLTGLAYPLHFYDYETFSSAIPASPGFYPHQAMPVQFSLHVLHAAGELNHFEYLASGHCAQSDLVDRLSENIGGEGDAIVWNESFEKGCNRRMANLLPKHADFLGRLNSRTVDLMIPFKEHYVDPGFQGSVSIKKVLPVLCPDLDYSENLISDGASAMAAFAQMVSAGDARERDRLRQSMLEYCKLDTLAMVRIFQFLQQV